MIPDEHPDSGTYMTLKDIDSILTEEYGRESNCPLSRGEIDQILALLRDGHNVVLYEADLILVPEGGPGLYAGYLRKGNPDVG